MKRRAASLLAPLLFAGCAAVRPPPPSTTPRAEPADWTLAYHNWTSEAATAFRLCLVQSQDETPPPRVPSVQTTAFARSVAPTVEKLDGERRRICYAFSGGGVAPGRTIVLSVGGRAIVTAAGVVAAWSGAAGEIDHTRTDSLMGRKATTQLPPASANRYHMEFVDPIGGVWVEGTKAKAALSDACHADDPYPHKLDFTDIAPPFDFTVDFANDGTGPRKGRTWWARDGERLGEITADS